MSAVRRPITTGRSLASGHAADESVLRADLNALIGARRLRTVEQLVRDLRSLADQYEADELAARRNGVSRHFDAPSEFDRSVRTRLTVNCECGVSHDLSELHRVASESAQTTADGRGELEQADLTVVGVRRPAHQLNAVNHSLDLISEALGLLRSALHNASSLVDGEVLDTPAVTPTVEDGADTGLSGHVGVSGEVTPQASPLDPSTGGTA